MSYFDPVKAEGIIIFMPDKHMGNVVMSLRAIKSMENYFKDKIKGIIIDELYKEILFSFFDNDIILPYNLRKKSSKIWYMREFLNFIKKIRRLKPTVSVDYEGRTTGAVLSFLSGARYRVGFMNSEKSYCYNVKILPDGNYKHKSEYYLSIPLKLGIPIIDKLTPTIKKEWEISLGKKLSNLGTNKNSKIVSIHPGAGKIYKKWPAKNFAFVADYLIENGYAVVFIGSERDEDDVLCVKSYMKNKAFDLCGKLSLGELMALFKKTKLYIGNDSGPMHLASLFNIPIIALFGSANEGRWRPFGDKVVTLRGAERCWKCKGRHCNKDFQCIKMISTDEVLRKVKILES
ncbi:MAG: glycosyltransferase family 9 protein [Candidatus Omnitrophica bacterium]|nr:glycosyltransferase family 9 protein [Candidatus Omnitrophota bacterium]